MADLIEDVPLRKTVVLVDTNVIIEAVRTGTWNALTGSVCVETVLDAVCDAVGARPKPPLKPHYQELFLSRHRTEYLLGG